MNNVKIVFCGLSKNCGETLIKNLKFIDRFIHSYKDYDIRSIVIESDSIDGSLEHLKNLHGLKLVGLQSPQELYKYCLQKDMVKKAH